MPSFVAIVDGLMVVDKMIDRCSDGREMRRRQVGAERWACLRVSFGLVFLVGWFGLGGNEHCAACYRRAGP